MYKKKPIEAIVVGNDSNSVEYCAGMLAWGIIFVSILYFRHGVWCMHLYVLYVSILNLAFSLSESRIGGSTIVVFALIYFVCAPSIFFAMSSANFVKHRKPTTTKKHFILCLNDAVSCASAKIVRHREKLMKNSGYFFYFFWLFAKIKQQQTLNHRIPNSKQFGWTLFETRNCKALAWPKIGSENEKKKKQRFTCSINESNLLQFA